MAQAPEANAARARQEDGRGHPARERAPLGDRQNGSSAVKGVEDHTRVLAERPDGSRSLARSARAEGRKAPQECVNRLEQSLLPAADRRPCPSSKSEQRLISR